MKTKTLTLTIQVEVEVEYTFKPGTKSSFDSGFGNHLPGDPPEVDIKNVSIGTGKVVTDITESLHPDLLIELGDEVIEFETEI